jgi:FixJ family two-component response regulator
MIAIIDDDASVRVAISSLVRSYGFAAEAFQSAEHFLTAVDSSRIYCVITDIQMPGMNGLELYKQMIDRRLSIPFVFMTAFHSNSIRDKALANGAVGFLLKPFSGAELVMQIELAVASRTPPP